MYERNVKGGVRKEIGGKCDERSSRRKEKRRKMAKKGGLGEEEDIKGVEDLEE